MNKTTGNRLIQAIQLLKLDGYSNYTNKQLEKTSGVSKNTIKRNADIIQMFEFILDKAII